jgi:hypothetical protein
MDKTRILQQGEEAKFKIAIKDLDMAANFFGLKLIYCYRQEEVKITKEMMFTDSGGEWYFTFGTDGIIGRVDVECEWHVPDTDFDEGYRVETDRQYLAFVAVTPDPNFLVCPQSGTDRPVTYTREMTSSIADKYDYLMDSEHRVLLTSEMDIILVNKVVNR